MITTYLPRIWGRETSTKNGCKARAPSRIYDNYINLYNYSPQISTLIGSPGHLLAEI